MTQNNIDVEVLNYEEYKVTINTMVFFLTRSEVETLEFYLSAAMLDADVEAKSAV